MGSNSVNKDHEKFVRGTGIELKLAEMESKLTYYKAT